MFEQSILAAQPAKRTWSLAVSLVAQISFIMILTLIPLIYTDQLPGLTKWAQNLVAPSPPPAPPPKIMIEPVSRPAAKESPVFTGPSRIPRQVAVIDDLNQRALDPGPVGVVGSSGPPSLTGDITRLLTNLIPPPKPPEPVHPEAPQIIAREPLAVSRGVQEAKLLRKIIPVYPPLAITTRTQGTVHLVGIIAKDGTIRDLRVVDGHPLLVRAALDAVRQWIYRPTLLSGEPVEVVAPIVVTFTLSH